MAASCPGTRSRTALTSRCYPAGPTEPPRVPRVFLAVLQHALQRFLHADEDLRRRLVGVDHHEPLRMLLGDLQVRVGHLRVEVLPLHLHPVGRLRRAEQPQLGLDVQQDHEVREQALRRPHVQRQHVLLAQAARPSLVRERRVDVAIGEDDLAVGERRPDDRRDRLRAARGEQQRLGARVELPGLRVEQHLTDLLAELGPPGLARHEHVQAERPDVLLGQPDLRALARALHALERDEQPGRRRPLQLRHEREGLGSGEPVPAQEPSGVEAGGEHQQARRPERHARSGQDEPLVPGRR